MAKKKKSTKPAAKANGKAKNRKKPTKATNSKAEQQTSANGNKKAKNKPGRPTKMTDETVKKLEFAFMQGLSDEESCLYADISKQTLYNYQEKNPEFLDRKTVLKSNLKMNAKLNLAKEVNESKNIELSLWVLERTAPEYRPKQEVTAAMDINTKYSQMTDEELAEMANKYDV